MGEILCVVGGEEHQVLTQKEDTFADLRERALEIYGNPRTPIEQWEVRDKDGYFLQLSAKVDSIDSARMSPLFINPRPGWGG